MTANGLTKRGRTVGMSRRRFLQGAAAGTVSAGALAAAGGSWSPTWAASNLPAIQSEPIELTYWHGWTEQWEEMVQFVVDMFHDKQDRIRIKPEVVPWNELLTKLTASIAAGNPPDVVTLFGSTAIPTLANEEAIHPLNDMEGMDLGAVAEWMDPNILRLGEYQDNLYGLSYWAGTYAIIYNQDHLAEAGLDPEVGPQTIAELDDMAEQLTERRDNDDIERMGFLPDQGHFWLWGTVFGGSFYDDANLQVTANDPKLVEALEWYASYAEKYDPRKVAAFQEGLADERAEHLDPLISGRFSLQTQGPWKLGDIRLFGDEDFQYGVVRPPLASEEEPPSNWTWGDIQIIPQGSKDPSAALEFVLHTAGVNDPEGYAQRVVWGNRPINVPVSRSVLDVPSFQEVVADYPGFETFIDALLEGERIGSPPVMPAAAFYNDRLTSTLERVMLLQDEPQAALDKLAEDVQRELDRSLG